MKKIINEFLEVEDLTAEQINLIERYVAKCKEEGSNLDYGFAANPNLKTYEDLVLTKWKDALWHGTTDKDFTEWLQEEIGEEIKEEIEETENVEDEAREAFDAFEETDDYMIDERKFRSFANKIISKIPAEKIETYQKVRKEKVREIRNRGKKPQIDTKESFVTGPLYDDEIGRAHV